jgi:hypothetical protein
LIGTNYVALPARYHTWQAHLVEVAVVIVVVLAAGFLVRAVAAGRGDDSPEDFASAVYKCLPDDGGHAFEREFDQLAVGVAFEHDGTHYLITQLPAAVTGKWRDPLSGEVPRILRVTRQGAA